ncbi:MAG TPA: response regulator [Hanamia sp.]
MNKKNNKENKNKVQKEQLKILIVDDNSFLRDSLKYFLESLRSFIFDIEQAASGEDWIFR